MTVGIAWQRVESFCAIFCPVFMFNFWEDIIYLLFRVASQDKACFEIFNVLFKCRFWRVCCKKPESFSFDKTIFNACWVTTVEVCVLKCFSRLKMCTHIENSFFLESFSLIYCCVQECSFYFWYFSSKLYSRVLSIGFLNENFYIFFVWVPQTEDVVNKPFPR